MFRRVDKIFKALENTKNYVNIEETVDNNSTPTATISHQSNENNIDTTARIIQDAEIIFVDSEGRLDDNFKEICQTLVRPISFSVSEEPPVPFELLDGRSAEEGNRNVDTTNDDNGILAGSDAATCYQNMLICDDNHEIFDGSNALTGNQNMETVDDNSDPDFQLNSKDSDKHKLSENVSVLQNDQINEANPQDESPKRKRSTKYEIHEDRWQKNENRLNREQGKSYKGKKKENGKWRYDLLREPRLMREICNCKLSRNKKSALMCTRISEDERRRIFEEFWRCSWSEKKMYVRDNVCVQQTSRKRGLNEVSRRTYSNVFYLGSPRIRVCKTMFLNTLGVKEWVIKKWAKNGVKEKPVTLSNHLQNSVVSKNGTKQLQRFFESLPKMESHYCRATTSKFYLEPMWTSKSKLYKFYKSDFCENEDIKPISIATFHKEFEKNRLSLYRPKKDLCDTCVSFQTGNISEEVYNEHIKFKDEARAEKNEDKQSRNDVFTMDLQSVLLCPKSNVSSLYYKTKLIVHNFTIYDIKRQKGFCYLWNESEGGLTSNEFTSIIIHFLKQHAATYYSEGRSTNEIQIILWSDGCGYQNRNSTLSNGILNFALESGITVIQKYLQKGHTQMEVDSVHSVIERQIRNKKIYIPADYVYVCKTACHKSPYHVEYLMHDFFKKYDHLKFVKTIRSGKVAGAPTVNDLKALKYSKDGIFYKLRHIQDWQILPIRLNINNIIPIKPDNIPQLHKNRLKIKAEKFQHLQQLKLSMEQDYHDFYDRLPHE